MSLRRVVLALALCVWAGLMLVQGFTGLVRLAVSDKVQHFMEFGVLSLLVLANMRLVSRRLWTVATMAVACVVSELMQAWLAQGRSFQWADVAANYLGSATFLTVAWVAEKRTWTRVPDEGSDDELDVELDEIVVSRYSTITIVTQLHSPPATMVRSTPTFTAERLAALQKSYSEAGQDHVFKFFGDLDDEEAAVLFEQLDGIQVERCNEFFDRTVRNPAAVEGGDKIAPLESGSFASTLDGSSSADDIAAWNDEGMRLIRANKVAVILLAGGQGTRLGSSEPKGCYDIGLPSGKCLFEIQAERIRRLQQIAAADDGAAATIPWLVMTSGPTSAATQKKFADSNYFGLNADDVFFFNQGVLPCFALDGKFMLEQPGRLAVAPDGNGGIYEALRLSGALDWLHERGVEHIHSYCVDNCLVRVADPTFIGYAALRGAECGALVVPKKAWNEPVGVICLRNERYSVVEYSEITEETAKQKRADTEQLAYNAGNICNHYYTLDFLRTRVPDIEAKLEHHIAKKKIKHVDLDSGSVTVPAKPNGIKLERFVFDVFPYVERMAILEVHRQDQFSPLKNAPGSGVDCPETSRSDLIAQCIRFAEAAGATLESLPEGREPSFEISALVSYAGEGLECLNGKTLAADQLINCLDDVVTV
ncbi:UDP-N-acetylglucosamine pyrophosphorylase [Coemansia aciculifera]|uniref:UDP-N-acetylglucosamine diphosphorylase n=1 Tax=Coemansia aciculifera TaxID=417176 RepID=A0A9W8M1Y3_9FUNG|nr:UDP-N-acetylglucosamine pyrophosphorylase [Coemansia aciculifera]